MSASSPNYEIKIAVEYKNYQGDPMVVQIVPLAKPPAPEPPKPKPVNQEPPQPPSEPVFTPHPAETTLISPVQETLSFGPPKPPPPVKPVTPGACGAPGDRQPQLVLPAERGRHGPLLSERGQRLDRSGNVTLQCQVTAKGAVADCAVLAEDPADFGFGDAALRLAQLFKMKPRMEDGQAVEGAMVKIPIAFRIAR
jgi:protein TonB